MAYKEGKYWRVEQDDLMRILFTTEQNSKEWAQAYTAVLPRLKKMAESILRRYYGWVSDRVGNDLMTDAIANLVMRGEHNPKRLKTFAYCGTIIKRYYYDILVSAKRPSTQFIDNNYDISDAEWLADHVATQPQDEFDLSERQRMFNDIMAIIESGVTTCQVILVRNRDRNYQGIQGSIREMEFLNVAKQYFLEYFMQSSVSARGMADYIQTRMEMPDYVVAQYMKRYFNIGSQPRRMDDKPNLVDWGERRGKSYLMDDYPPSTKLFELSRIYQGKKNKSGGNEYF